MQTLLIQGMIRNDGKPNNPYIKTIYTELIDLL